MHNFSTGILQPLSSKKSLQQQLNKIYLGPDVPLNHPSGDITLNPEAIGKLPVIAGNFTKQLTKILSAYAQVLKEAHELLNALDQQNIQALQSRDLLQTTYNIIRDQIHKTNRLLLLAENDLAGVNHPMLGNVPRVYALCNWLVQHTSAKLDAANLWALVGDCQQVMDLHIADLKAIRGMLKLVLIDHLQRIALRMSASALGIAPKDGAETANDTADKVMFRNITSSLRVLDTIDWHQFIDQVNIIEPLLNKDPAGVYQLMDFYTRENYLTAIGDVARLSKRTELEVAQKVMTLSLQAPPDTPAAHVGFFLVGEGRGQLEKTLEIPNRCRKNSKQVPTKISFNFYLGIILAFTLLLLILVSIPLYHHHIKAWPATLMVILLLIMMLGISRLVADTIAMLTVKPSFLPRLDFSEGVPSNHATLVVIPAILTSETSIESLVSGIEVRFLGNRDENIRFALLTDYADANAAEMPGDIALLNKAKSCINALNAKYNTDCSKHFYLFHRPRQWNAKQGVWMGWERKRGKLLALNEFLRGYGEQHFEYVSASTDLLQNVKYIITLDSDTQLPRYTAWKMIAAMAHPLNAPVYSEKKKRITAGYGVLQPRVGLDIRGMSDSYYQHMHSVMPDIDPYNYAAPDVYQDLFGEGSFVGKGIYHIDTVIKVVHDAFPENRVLSHDLIEGCYIRSGLLNDVTLYEHSVDYWSDVRRRHRWIRGDWQIASWIGLHVPHANGKTKVRNPLSALSRWKIFDNLRNSLVPLAQVFLLVLGWLLLQFPLYWTLIMILPSLFPGMLIVTKTISERPDRLISYQHWGNAFKEASGRFFIGIYSLVCLPYEAWYAFDAIVLRTGWRMLFSHKKMLEWTASDSHSKAHDTSIGHTYLRMLSAPVVAIMIGLALWSLNLESWWHAAPLLILWILSPAMAWYMNRSYIKKGIILTKAQEAFIRRIARKTSAYFEEFVNEAHNWLPPDHYQEYPSPKDAAYTSPTNIGLALLSYITANDFGYITQGRLLQTTTGTLQTMGKLERYKGHFYNWYNTQTLMPATPRYVSTVDSGNLAGHLYVFKQGIKALCNQPVISKVLFTGLYETIGILNDAFKEHSGSKQDDVFILPDEPLQIINLQLGFQYLQQVLEYVRHTYNQAQQSEETNYWWKVLNRQCNDISEEMLLLAPWLQLPTAPEKYKQLIPVAFPVLNELSAYEVQLENTGNEAEDEWLQALHNCRLQAKQVATKRLQAIAEIMNYCVDYAIMEYGFVYDESAHLLSIGYHVESGCADTDCYDVLASEARLAAFIGICQDKLPVKSWFSLGRPLVNTQNTCTLLSANGTMFEYLMPLLVMPAFEHSLLLHACNAAIQKQIDYGNKYGIPWGISESCYGIMDNNDNYQYKVFGVPGLSLKHNNTNNEMVITPYASAMALMLAPQAACQNLENLSSYGFEGRYGLYEAIDYTSYVAGQSAPEIVKSYMVHHQGMSFLAFGYLLLNQPMQKHFMNDPELQSSMLLLQEGLPKDISSYLQDAEIDGHSEKMPELALPHETDGSKAGQNKATIKPQMHLLSNGSYHLMLGEGENNFCRWGTNLRSRSFGEKVPDAGMCCVINDLENDTRFIASVSLPAKDDQKILAFNQGYTDVYQKHNDLEIHTHIIVAPEIDIEVRHLKIQNTSSYSKTIELQNICELGMELAGSRETSIVPFFHKEVIHDGQAIISCNLFLPPNQQQPWTFHTVTVHTGKILNTFCETDSVHLFLSDTDNVQLLNASAIKYRLLLKAGEQVTLTVCRGVAESRMACLALILQCRQPDFSRNLIAEVYQNNLVVLQRINAVESDLQLCNLLAVEILRAGNISSGFMFDYKPSFDKQPLIILRIHSCDHIEVVAKMIQLHAYWHLKGWSMQLEIWNEDDSSYNNFLQRLVMELITSGIGAEAVNRNTAGIFVKYNKILSEADYATIPVAACVINAAEWMDWNARINDDLYSQN
ncbi:hypothetical protein OQX63_05260 [Pedobacter sp. PF22-3]|uniref:glucoamylase family protein n=1 Tax=Pedobacter sp. PF22-3 TaxID=2994467 RepID=UPI002247FAFE|nr:glucoamylase family protein [Pedobacter sp. PF22-3]MCX2492869.1 hypothetical protein [Pedobacter sp. PF22-3]